MVCPTHLCHETTDINTAQKRLLSLCSRSAGNQNGPVLQPVTRCFLSTWGSNCTSSMHWPLHLQQQGTGVQAIHAAALLTSPPRTTGTVPGCSHFLLLPAWQHARCSRNAAPFRAPCARRLPLHSAHTSWSVAAAANAWAGGAPNDAASATAAAPSAVQSSSLVTRTHSGTSALASTTHSYDSIPHSL